jgi:hypothetical protein
MCVANAVMWQEERPVPVGGINSFAVLLCSPIVCALTPAASLLWFRYPLVPRAARYRHLDQLVNCDHSRGSINPTEKELYACRLPSQAARE